MFGRPLGAWGEHHCLPITLHCVLIQHHQNPYNRELIWESIILCYNAKTYNHHILGLQIPLSALLHGFTYQTKVPSAMLQIHVF